MCTAEEMLHLTQTGVPIGWLSICVLSSIFVPTSSWTRCSQPLPDSVFWRFQETDYPTYGLIMNNFQDKAVGILAEISGLSREREE